MYQEASSYLQSIRAAYITIENKKRALAQYDYMLETSGVSYDPDKVSVSPKQDGLEKKAIKHLETVAELRAEIAEAIAWRATRINEATTFISEMDSMEQQEVLMLRYIEQKSWSEILDIRGCDDISGQYQLHKRALAKFQEILDAHSIPTT